MDEMEEDPPPFWLQSNTARRHHAKHHRRCQSQVSSLFLNTGVLVIVLLGAAVVFLVIVIPSVLSLARQVFNPSLVKSSWNSLNIILVLFAIICGFLGRRDEDQVSATNTPRKREADQPAGSSPRQWYDYQGRVAYNSFGNADTIRKVIRRNSSSYPDLRQESQWVTRENNMWRSYDDIDVHNPQVLRSDSQITYHRTLREVDEDEDDAKTIEVDVGESQVSPPSTPPLSPSPSPPPPPPPPPPPQPAARKTVYGRSKIAVDEAEVIAKKIEIDAFIGNQAKYLPPSNQRSVPCPSPPVHQPTTPPSPPAYIRPPPSSPSYYWPPPSPTSYMWPPPSPPPPPPPPRLRMQSSATDRKKTKRTYETIGRQSKWESSTKRESIPRVQVPPSPPPPPPPPPPPRRQSRPLASQYEKGKDNIGEKKRGSVTKDFLTSFYHQRKKKKKQRRRSYENLEEFTEPPTLSIHRSKPTPEFPPPSPPPPPPPPPPSHSVFHNLFSSKKGKSKKKIHSVPTAAPPTSPPPPPRPSSSKLTSSAPRRAAPPPAKTVSFSSTVEHVGNGSESPLLPIPPPPPPPPFKMPSWKFIGQGDYVKLESNSNSPRSGYSASEEDEGSPSIKKTSNPKPSQFCPSPDVNIKADDFIARFREKLQLEKVNNSIKQKQGNAPSPLGPEARLTRTWST